MTTTEMAPLLTAALVGFTHAFEADHLVAVSNIVTRRTNPVMALKDGIYWGLGHTSTILVVGSIFLLGRFIVRENDFRYFEAGVGFMLMGLGLFRLARLYQNAAYSHKHHPDEPHAHPHKLAYGVGLIHGLAGSGALILSVLATSKGTFGGLVYLSIFGIGSIGGMMLAAGLFSVPFSGRLIQSKSLQTGLSTLSSLLCMSLGAMVVYENLITQ